MTLPQDRKLNRLQRVRVDRKHYQLHAKERYTNPDLFFLIHIRHLDDSLNHGDTLLLLQDVSEKLTGLGLLAFVQAGES